MSGDEIGDSIEEKRSTHDHEAYQNSLAPSKLRNESLSDTARTNEVASTQASHYNASEVLRHATPFDLEGQNGSEKRELESHHVDEDDGREFRTLH